MIGHAFATATLRCKQETSGNPWQIDLKVWNRSYDDPDLARRNSLITAVKLVDLPPSSSYHLTTQSITDSTGTDFTTLWPPEYASNSVGHCGAAQYDTAGKCGPGLPSVFWFCNTGIYDERCLRDPECDAWRLQTHRAGPQITIFNYLVSPVTFRFTLAPFSPNTGVKIQITSQFIGGNGGNPSNHGNLAQEHFFLKFV